MWSNSKTQIVMKLNNLNYDETQVVIKLKLWLNSNCDGIHITQICDKTQKLKLWRNWKTPIVMKLKLKCDKIEKLNLWQNSKTQIGTKLKKKKKCKKIKKFKKCYKI